MERLSPDTQATLLLLSPLRGSGAKPLTVAEYNGLAKELHNRNLRPADLIGGPFKGYLVDAKRLEALMSRGTALALTLERWSQAGVRVLSRSDPVYPAILKTKLRSAASPLLFYSGEIGLLEGEAVCIVGSRDPTAMGLQFARAFGAACAQQGFVVVSGDARGVDREAMTAALEAGGRGVGVLAEALSAAVLVRRNREQILRGRLLLISPYDPDARFTVARAMDRNRYLYALASAAMIVDSDVSGGTWSGALENLKHSWAPALVRIGAETRPGNSKLAELGLKAFEDRGEAISIRNLIEQAQAQRAAGSAPELPLDSASSSASQPTSGADGATDASELFEMFFARLRRFLEPHPRTEAEIAAHFQLDSRQVRNWLAVAQQRQGIVRVGDRLQWKGGGRAA
jgi:predicted Rossmann fold nucleotide-binding protein DprA/Smf involved in DNA uptake